MKVIFTMYLCLCHAVTDRTVRNAAREGSCTFEDVSKRTCAGTGCGMCRDDVHRIVREERERRSVDTVTSK